MSCSNCQQAEAAYLAASSDDRVVVAPCACRKWWPLKYTRGPWLHADVVITKEGAQEILSRYRDSASAVTKLWESNFAEVEARVAALRATRSADDRLHNENSAYGAWLRGEK